MKIPSQGGGGQHGSKRQGKLPMSNPDVFADKK